MPIDYYIDHAQHLVVARGSGVFSHEDVFGYQRTVWTRADVAGYDELVDMSDVEEIDMPDAPSFTVRQLAAEAATSDPPGPPAKFAIVAPDSLAYGLGRMYQAYRELEPGSTKQVNVFRSMPEALAFLGIERLDKPDTA